WARLDGGWKDCDKNILYRLDPGVDAAVTELWRSSYRVAELSDAIAGAMATHPRHERVPRLTECVRAEGLGGGSSAEGVRTAAIRALTARLDDLGADALLKAI